MKKIIQSIYIFSFLLTFMNLLYAEDLRDFKVGASIELVPERGYVNLKCEDKTEIFKWINFK